MLGCRPGPGRIWPGGWRVRRLKLPAWGPARSSASTAHARSTTTAAAPRALRVGELDLDRATIESLAVERADGLLGFLVGRHLHEAEPSRLPRVPVGDDRGGLHRPALDEMLAQGLGCSRIRETAHIQLDRHGTSFGDGSERS